MRVGYIEYKLPSSEWLNTLKIGDNILLVYTAKVGEEALTKEVKIKSISKTGIISVEGSGSTFQNGYRRGFQYSGNCWLQPIK